MSPKKDEQTVSGLRRCNVQYHRVYNSNMVSNTNLPAFDLMQIKVPDVKVNPKGLAGH